MPESRIVIFANGALPDLERARGLINGNETIICADGGTHHALALGAIPAVVIGDLDSLVEQDREKILAGGTTLVPHSRDKDETDLELALHYAREMRPRAIVIAGALGRRLDQTLGNIALLGDPRLGGIDCRLDDGLEEALFCTGSCEIRGAPDDIISLLPWGTIATGVRTEGLRWPLAGEVLYPERTRGISNAMISNTAAISVKTGRLLVIHRRRP